MIKPFSSSNNIQTDIRYALMVHGRQSQTIQYIHGIEGNIWTPSI